MANGDICGTCMENYGKLSEGFFSFILKLVFNKEEKMEDMSLHQLQMYTEGHTIGLSFRDTLILSKGIGQASENHKVRVS